MWEQRMEIEGPYNFDLVLERLELDPLNSVDREARIARVPIYEPENEVVEVQAIGTLDEPVFLIKGKKDETKEIVQKRIAHVFQWDIPLSEIHSHFQESDLKDIFHQHRGTPLILDFSPYSCLVKCIIHQQLNLKFAFTLTERFVQTYGEEIDDVWFYPSPERSASLTIEELRELQFSQRKAEYIIGLSEMIVSGKLDLEQLSEESDETIMKTLVKIRGVGPWTAQNFLLFGLGRPNLFPTGDVGIQNALKKLYQLEAKPDLNFMEQSSEKWKPYLSYASLYLWRSIEVTE
ncbi:DNA-3-methyladenine glycosylase family protein [Falsibacillus pallidus]|uniref:DNA-3-methyladenine glycosylase II n=1 Tax=Falsibacillus pallidus TaxID=493781 RepID=A0A370GEI2_9BACI|nr:DNA-3-methyladenine glycosylase [Falsibacillus pallidus]RDI42208.1 DNA-3-methyladenine glycosylase II [Falsibacillus pallidus]